jgi:hypothetical protein
LPGWQRSDPGKKTIRTAETGYIIIHTQMQNSDQQLEFMSLIDFSNARAA